MKDFNPCRKKQKTEKKTMKKDGCEKGAGYNSHFPVHLLPKSHFFFHFSALATISNIYILHFLFIPVVKNFAIQ